MDNRLQILEREIRTGNHMAILSYSALYKRIHNISSEEDRNYKFYASSHHDLFIFKKDCSRGSPQARFTAERYPHRRHSPSTHSLFVDRNLKIKKKHEGPWSSCKEDDCFKIKKSDGTFEIIK